MNNNLYEKNIELLKKQFGEERCEKLKNREYLMEDDINIDIDYSRTGEKIFKVEKNERTLYLTGKYNPSALIEKRLQEKKINFASKIFILGIESCTQIKECLRQMTNGQIIIVYEPCINIFIKVMEEIDLEEIIKSKQLVFFVEGINEEYLENTVKTIIDYEDFAFFNSFITPNYIELFYERVKKVEKKVSEALRSILIQWNTLVRFTDINAENILNNLCKITETKNFANLAGKLPKDIPTIIVSAGPSLDKNIDDLKAAYGKAFIIATDTAIKSCLRHGIKPDMLVIIDGKKEKELFEKEDLTEIPLLMNLEVPYAIADMFKKTRLLSYSNTPLLIDIVSNINQQRKESDKIDISNISGGGSVAHSAFLAGIEIGSKNIILIGQDLAFTGNKSHAADTMKNGIKDDISTYPLVESVDGGLVRSRADFILYREWFEKKIESLNGYRVIDATEGGAKIKGTEIMTLKEAIEIFCKKEISIKEMFDKIPETFSEDEKIFIKEYLKDLLKKFDVLEEKSIKGIRFYEELDDISNYSSVKTKQLNKVIKNITEINEYIESDIAARTTVDSLKDLEKILRGNIYSTKEDQSEELKEIASYGKIMLTNINRKSKEIKDIYEKILYERGLL